MGAAMIMENAKPAMFCFHKKETLNAPQANKFEKDETEKFLTEHDFEMKQGSWTTEKTCLLKAALSFFNSTSLENITNMYNFVCTSAFTCTANCKSVWQITRKLNYVKGMQNAPQKMLYGITVLDSPT